MRIEVEDLDFEFCLAAASMGLVLSLGVCVVGRETGELEE
jgi:hypothetical protein